MQEQVLERHPEADIGVLVVWMPVLPTDERFGVSEEFLDERVTHFWDDDRLASDEVGKALDTGDQLAWDVFLVYGPDATWDDRLPEPLGVGAPVVAEMARLETLLEPYLE